MITTTKIAIYKLFNTKKIKINKIEIFKNK